MTFKELTPGRYDCRITDWTLEQVAQLDNALKVIIQLSITVPDQEPVTGRWDGLLETKDGKPNKKTIKTLLSSGFRSDDIYTLATDGAALDTQKAMEATIIKNDKGFTTVEWLNSAGEGSGLKKEKISGRTSPALKSALALALKEKGEKKKVKNHAPGATHDPDVDDVGF